MPEPSEFKGRFSTELYPRPEGGESKLAALLHETGLLGQLNSAVLHPHGLALGVIQNAEKEIVGLSLHETDDPLGIWFDEKTTDRIRVRMRAAGLLREERAYSGAPNAEGIYRDCLSACDVRGGAIHAAECPHYEPVS